MMGQQHAAIGTGLPGVLKKYQAPIPAILAGIVYLPI